MNSSLALDNGVVANVSCIVINEVMYDSKAAPESDHEWIELYNTCNETIEMTGWKISDNSSKDNIPAVTVLPHGFVVIAAKTNFSDDYPDFNGSVVFINGSIGSGLNNDGDRITLNNSEDVVIDHLSYGKDKSVMSLPDVDEGCSLERQPVGGGNFINNSAPTPGFGFSDSNSTPTPGPTPTPSSTPESSSTLEPTPTLSPAMTPDCIPEATPSPMPTSTADPPPTPEPSATPGATPLPEPTTIPTVAPSLTPAVSPTPTPVSTGTVANMGSLLINEVMYDSKATSDADYEWVELYNTCNETIDIVGWGISDNYEKDELPSLNISANGAVVVAASENFSVNFPNYTGTTVFIADGRIGNGLGNAGDRLILKDSAGTIIDEMSYGEDSGITSPPYPNVAEGHSLERAPCGGQFVDNEEPTPGSCLLDYNPMPVSTPTPIPVSTPSPVLAQTPPELNSNDSINVISLHSIPPSRPASDMAHISSSIDQHVDSPGDSLRSLLVTLSIALLLILGWTLYRRQAR